jgi:hypothetical protein
MRKVIVVYILGALSLVCCKNPLVEGIMTSPEKPEYTVKVENSGGGTVKVSPGKEKYADNEQIKVEAVADEGYEFKGWQGNMTGAENPAVVKVTEDMWIIPRFEALLNYRLTTEWSPLGGSLQYSYGDGVFSEAVQKTKFLPGEQCAIRAIPADSYRFDGWTGDIESPDDTVFITFDRDYQVYPKFSIMPSPVTYTITGSVPPGGTLEYTPSKTEYYENEIVMVTAKPDNGYEFKGWQGSVTGSANPLIIKLTEDMWIIPRFEEAASYRLTTEWSPAGGILFYSYDGIFNTTVSKTNFLPGEQCAIRAVPLPGYRFDRWEGDIESVNDTIYITFDGNYQVYPKFSVIASLVTYTITASVPAGGTVEYIPSKTEYYENEVVMVTAKPDSGYIFGQWSGDHAGTEASFSLTMNSDKNIAPAFIRREWTFMVYMAADNDLDAVALDDFNELEAVDYTNKPVSVLVLIDRINGSSGNWSDTRLYEVKGDLSGKNAVLVSTRLDGRPELNIPGGSNAELDTSNRFVLSGFIDYAKRAYKADNYGLIVWGYGLGWKGYALDTTSGSSMPLSSLGNAVEGKGLGLIGFDTGFGVTLESAYELRNAAGYLVGSPGTVSDSEKGWDYRALFSGFLSKASRTAKAFCDSAVDQFRQQYVTVNGACISVIDSSETASLFSAFEGFSGGVAGTLTDLAAKEAFYTRLLNGTVRLYYDGSAYPADAYADLYSISLEGSGAGLRSALGRAVSTWSNEYGESRPLMGVFVNSLTSGTVFSPGHAAGYRKGQGTIKFVADSINYAPSGSAAGTGLLDKLFYYSY